MMSGPRFGATVGSANCNGGSSGVTGRDGGRNLCAACAVKKSLIRSLLSARGRAHALMETENKIKREKRRERAVKNRIESKSNLKCTTSQSTTESTVLLTITRQEAHLY